ncbi:MAG: glycosyltransferase [Candidatus Omnitrophica bacterium]|nr:glycosyltransferase [Candidatus Omnitrophota bacterium]
MKILMMTNSYFPHLGGLEQSLTSFSHELRKLGHDVLIAAPGPAGRADKKENVARLPAFHHKNGKGIEFSINLPLPGEFSRIMDEFRPDIIHSHYPFFMGDFAVRLSRQYHVPLVFSYHIMFEHYVHYLPIRTQGVKRFLITLASGYANMCRHVIAPSQSVRDILIKRRVRAPITVVPTGVNTRAFAKGNGKLCRQKNRIPADAMVIGHVSRLAPEKNLDFMVPALVELLKKDGRVHALIVGQGPSVPMIRNKFKHAGLQKRLHLTGYLDGQGLTDAYHAMDVFAFASLSETQGIVLIEALASGVPVVAINAPGVREVIQNYANGRSIPRPDQKRFIEALEWVLKRPADKFKTLKKQARNSAEEYSIRNCTLRMLKIYKQLIARKAPFSQYHKNSWQSLQDRVKTDWDIIRNVIKAGEAGIFNWRLIK